MFRNLLLTWWLGALLGGPVSAQVVGNDVTPLEPGRARLTYIYIGSNGSLSYNAQGQASLRISSDSDNHGLRLTVGLVDDLDIHIQTGEGFVSREDGSRFTSPTFGSGADDSQVRLRWRFLNRPFANTRHAPSNGLAQPVNGHSPLSVKPPQ